MPTLFFETFPIGLTDEEGIVRADVLFRRAESKYSVEQAGLNGTKALCFLDICCNEVYYILIRWRLGLVY